MDDLEQLEQLEKEADALFSLIDLFDGTLVKLGLYDDKLGPYMWDLEKYVERWSGGR